MINLICDSAASTAYEEVNSASDNPQVVNTPGCTTNYCSVVINWRTSAVCSGGLGWMIVIAISVAAGLYVGGGIGYTRYENGHWDASEGRILAAHPHWHHWHELADLVREGAVFARQRARGGVRGATDKSSSKGDDYDELLGEAEEAPSRRPARGRRSSEPVAGDSKKKKKKKKKPRPSEPIITNDADGKE